LTLPISVGAAVLFSLGQLAETGELSASRTLGASPLQLSLPAILLTLGVSGATIAAASLEGAALRSLKESIAGGATRSLLGSIRPGGFRQLPGDVVIYVERRLSPGRFGGVMMARPGQLLLAREAVFEQEQEQGSSSVVQMRLTEGELHLVTPNRALTRVRFGELEQTLDLRRLLQRHFGFISPERRRTDTVGAAAITLALGLLATVVGLSGRRRTRVVIVGLGLVVAVQLLCWALGGPLLPGIVALGCVGWLLWISRARRS
jgi:hypothetical protein